MSIEPRGIAGNQTFQAGSELVEWKNAGGENYSATKLWHPSDRHHGLDAGTENLSIYWTRIHAGNFIIIIIIIFSFISFNFFSVKLLLPSVVESPSTNPSPFRSLGISFSDGYFIFWDACHAHRQANKQIIQSHIMEWYTFFLPLFLSLSLTHTCTSPSPVARCQRGAIRQHAAVRRPTADVARLIMQHVRCRSSGGEAAVCVRRCLQPHCAPIAALTYGSCRRHVWT